MKIGDRFRCIENETVMDENGERKSIREGDIFTLIKAEGDQKQFQKSDKSFIFYLSDWVISQIFSDYFEPLKEQTNRIRLLRNPGCYNAQDTYRKLDKGEIIIFEVETPTEYIYREAGNIANFVEKVDAEPIYD